MAFFSEIHTKHINTLCGQNVEVLDVKLDFRRLNILFFKISFVWPYVCICVCSNLK